MNGKIVGGVAAAAVVAAVAIWAVDVDVTDSGSLPSADVKVDVEPGTLPEAEVDTVDVEVGTTEKEVTVEKETVTVPTLDVKEAEATPEGAEEKATN